MPTGQKNPTLRHAISMRVHAFDALQGLGGEIEETGRSIQKLAIHYPATKRMIVSDLRMLRSLCRQAEKALA